MVSCTLHADLLHHVSSSPGTNTDCAAPAAAGTFEQNYKAVSPYSYTRLDRETGAHNLEDSGPPAVRICFYEDDLKKKKKNYCAKSDNQDTVVSLSVKKSEVLLQDTTRKSTVAGQR